MDGRDRVPTARSTALSREPVLHPMGPHVHWSLNHCGITECCEDSKWKGLEETVRTTFNFYLKFVLVFTLRDMIREPLVTDSLYKDPKPAQPGPDQNQEDIAEWVFLFL